MTEFRSPSSAAGEQTDLVEIREVDSGEASEELLRSIAEMITACERAIEPNDPAWTVPAVRTQLHPGNELTTKRHFVAVEDESILGLTTVELDHDDNQHIVDAMIQVHPEHLRRSVGTALVHLAVDVAREVERPSLVTWCPRSDASHEFWNRLQMPEVLVDRRSRLVIADVDHVLLQRWRSESLARKRGYVLHKWTGRVPDDMLPEFIAAQKAMNDAPLDDLDMTHVRIDERWIRTREESFAGRNMFDKALLAVDADGEPAGVTDLTLFGDRPWFVQQQTTATLPPHRNQGLGRWMKAEMLLDLIADHPEREYIETGNADSNAPMLAINTEMGFRPHVEFTVRQAPVDAVEAALAAS